METRRDKRPDESAEPSPNHGTEGGRIGDGGTDGTIGINGGVSGPATERSEARGEDEKREDGGGK